MSLIGSSDLIGRAAGGRKLIAVVYADMVGYSRLIGLDDMGTLGRLRALRSALIDPAIDEHGGRIVQTGGDSLLIVFDSIDGAVRCAIQIQQRIPGHDADQPPDRAIRFRVGINIGDVIADGTDLHGRRGERGHLGAGCYQDALEWVDESVREQPGFAAGFRVKQALCGHLGHVAEARECRARLLDLQPALTVAAFEAHAATFLSPDIAGIMVAGLRKAGLPEH